MRLVRNDIIEQLEKAILPLQGLKPATAANALGIGFKPIENAFPNSSFPAGAIHEFLSTRGEESAATGGFIAALLNRIAGAGTSLWISTSTNVFPPALEVFGLNPGRMLFVKVKKESDALWAMEEALKCERLSAVVGEIRDINLTASRRLQLAVEQSKITGFLLRNNPSCLNPVAAVSRWHISPVPGYAADGLPGVGFPAWNVELLKVRNGKPGSWKIGWWDGQFHNLQESQPAIIGMPYMDIRKTG